MSDRPPAPADPHLDAAVADVLDVYREALPTPVVADMAELLRAELARHPVSARLLRQLAPAPVVTRSADVTHGEEAGGGEAAPREQVGTTRRRHGRR